MVTLEGMARLAVVGREDHTSARARFAAVTLTGLAGLGPEPGLEHSGEPVPFRVPDPRQDLLLLAGYLCDLLSRAAAATGSDRPAIVARALTTLAA